MVPLQKGISNQMALDRRQFRPFAEGASQDGVDMIQNGRFEPKTGRNRHASGEVDGERPLGSVVLAALAVVCLLGGLGAGCERGDGDGKGGETRAATGAERPKTTGSKETADGKTEASGGESAAAGADGGEEAAESMVASETLPEAPKRIVSLAPNVTETLFALGVGERVVAVTNFCDYPEAVEELPSVGTFSNPDFETILARRPDLVVGVISGGDKAVADKLEQAGVPYAFLRMYSVEDTLRGLETIGELVGLPEKGDALVAEVRREMEGVGRPEGSSPDVLLVYGHEPLVAAGPGTFGHQLVERAGGHNVLAGSDNKFPRLDMEKILELQPDRILDTSMVSDEEARAFWERQADLKAVQDDAVVHLNDPVVMRPGPRLGEALSRVSRAIQGAADHGAGQEEADGDGSAP